VPATPDPTAPKIPADQVVINRFDGFVPNADPHTLPPGGSVKQVNITSIRPGELRVRHGFRFLTFRN
jgi:hypothetical protein